MIQHHAIAIAIQATEVVDGHSDIDMAFKVAREQHERIALNILALAKAVPELRDELLKSINLHMKFAQDGESREIAAGPEGSRGRSGQMNGIGITGWEWAEGMTLREMIEAYDAWSDRESEWWRKVAVCQRALSLWEDGVPEAAWQSANDTGGSEVSAVRGTDSTLCRTLRW